jgi:putative ABC transport system substrate-binding protein
MTGTGTRCAAAAAFSLLVALLNAEAQPAPKVHRIGFLSSGSSLSPVHEGFRQGLRELGWIEGQNVVIDYRFADGHDRLPAPAADLVRLKVDIIVALATPATAAVKNATATIPIVMIGAGDPVGSGFIASLARPGGNVTGVTYTGGGMRVLAKQLELLVEAVPKVSRIAVLSNPTNQNHPVWMKEIRDAGRSLGVQLQLLEARGPNEFEGVFAAMTKERAGALLVMADALFIGHRTRVAALAAKNRLPSLGYREIVEAGGLMSYGPSLPDLGRHAAAYVDKILKGAKPADLPVEQPTKLELVINLRAARALGFTIPPRLLVRADQIID